MSIGDSRTERYCDVNTRGYRLDYLTLYVVERWQTCAMRLWTLHVVIALAGALVTLSLAHFPRVTLPGNAMRQACAAPATTLDADICAENRVTIRGRP